MSMYMMGKQMTNSNTVAKVKNSILIFALLFCAVALSAQETPAVEHDDLYDSIIKVEYGFWDGTSLELGGKQFSVSFGLSQEFMEKISGVVAAKSHFDQSQEQKTGEYIFVGASLAADIVSYLILKNASENYALGTPEYANSGLTGLAILGGGLITAIIASIFQSLSDESLTKGINLYNKNVLQNAETTE